MKDIADTVWHAIAGKSLLCPIIMTVSASEILGPIDYLSDIENLASFERAMFEDYSSKNKMKIFLLFMSILPLSASRTVYMSNIGMLDF